MVFEFERFHRIKYKFLQQATGLDYSRMVAKLGGLSVQSCELAAQVAPHLQSERSKRAPQSITSPQQRSSSLLDQVMRARPPPSSGGFTKFFHKLLPGSGPPRPPPRPPPPPASGAAPETTLFKADAARKCNRKVYFNINIRTVLKLYCNTVQYTQTLLYST